MCMLRSTILYNQNNSRTKPSFYLQLSSKRFLLLRSLCFLLYNLNAYIATCMFKSFSNVYAYLDRKFCFALRLIKKGFLHLMRMHTHIFSLTFKLFMHSNKVTSRLKTFRSFAISTVAAYIF